MLLKTLAASLLTAQQGDKKKQYLLSGSGSDTIPKILCEASELSEGSENIQTMADLLRQGATLTDLSCPACSSPLFRVKSGELWCTPCQKRVIEVKEGEKPMESSSPLVLSTLESTLLTQIQELDGRIKGETDLEQLQRLSDILSTLLEILERVRKMKTGHK